jgi:desulfoferrodoxin-like iron-binding protein
MDDHLRCEKCGKLIKIVDQGIGELVCCDRPMTLLAGFKTSDDVLNFAIVKEQEAEKFYTDWAQKIKDTWIKGIFTDFAKEEHKHMEILVKAKNGKILKSSEKRIPDLKISDYLVDLSPNSEMDYQQALTIAMKKEKASFKLYSDLAKLSQGTSLYETLLALAQEEAKHKVRLETIYDDDILGGN